MDAEKRARLYAAGYRSGDAADFLGMDDEERAELARWEASDQGPDAILAERERRIQQTDIAAQVKAFRAKLAREVRTLRLGAGLTQKQLAELAGSTAPKISNVEKGADGVALDLMVRAYYAAGGSSELLVIPPRRLPEASRKSARPKRLRRPFKRIR